MINSLKVSIISPNFNRADTIAETIDSIKAQTYQNWEQVIVDDGSTDQSIEIIEKYVRDDNRIRFFSRDREPKGAAACRNIAVEKSTGNYLLFLDTDDIMAPFCLEQRVKAMEENPESDFIFFPMLLFRKKPGDTNILFNVDRDEDDICRLFKGDPVGGGTATLWKKEPFVKMGMWDESLKLWQDIDLHLRAMLQGLKCRKMMGAKPDIYFRQTENSLSRGGYNSPPKLKSRFDVLHKNIQIAFDNNKFDNYRESIKYMYAGIFRGAVSTRNIDILRQLNQLQKKNKLFTYPEYTLFRKTIIFVRYYLSKIYPFNRTVSIIQKKFVPHNATLGKMRYPINECDFII